MIGLTLKYFSGSVLAPGMLYGDYNMLFIIFCAGNRLKQEKN